MAEKRQRRSPPPSRQGKLLSYCPVCESSHHLTEARVLEEREDGHLMHVQCRKCSSCLLVLVTSDPHGVSALSMLTDLGYDEVGRFSSQQHVSADDVLLMHALVSQSSYWMASES